MEWCKINTKYLEYLRNNEPKVPFDDYGSNAYKPFFHKLFSINENIEYVTCITHPKGKYEKYSSRLDFQKIYLTGEKGNSFLAGAVFLNNMIPVPKECIDSVNARNIQNFRNFENDKEKSKYISFLKKELKAIEKLNIDKKAKNLYDVVEKYPNNPIAKRCLDFKKMDELADNYIN